jgi:ABC-2 type transport system ATP-binding protein
MSAAIETKALTYRTGRGFVLDGIDLNVPAGSMYGFLGPNGSGKTTTIRLLLGHLKAGGGSVQLLGEPIPKRAAQVLARVGYVPERPHRANATFVVELSRDR